MASTLKQNGTTAKAKLLAIINRAWRSAPLARLASPLVLLVLWQLGSALGLIPTRTLASPLEVTGTLWNMIASGELGSNLAVSLARAAAGLAIGVTLGTTLAILSGLSGAGEATVDGPIQMLRTLPPLALTPLFIVWFGIGETAKIALIAFATTFPIYLNLYAGIRAVDPKLCEAGRTLGLGRAALIRHVILPGALPSFLTGLRYAISFSLLVLVVAETINAASGLGYLIGNARDFMRTDIIVVCLIVYAALGFGGDLLVRAIESRALTWRPRLREF